MDIREQNAWRRIEDIHSDICWQAGSFFHSQDSPEHNCFGECKITIRLILLLSQQQSRLNVSHIVLALNYFTVVCNANFVIVELVIFSRDRFYNLCKDEKYTVWFIFVYRSFAKFALFRNQNDEVFCLFGWPKVSLYHWAKWLSFDKLDPNSFLGF